MSGKGDLQQRYMPAVKTLIVSHRPGHVSCSIVTSLLVAHVLHLFAPPPPPPITTHTLEQIKAEEQMKPTATINATCTSNPIAKAVCPIRLTQSIFAKNVCLQDWNGTSTTECERDRCDQVYTTQSVEGIDVTECILHRM